MRLVTKIFLLLGAGLLVYGLVKGGVSLIWERATRLCLSCMGLQ